MSTLFREKSEEFHYRGSENEQAEFHASKIQLHAFESLLCEKAVSLSRKSARSVDIQGGSEKPPPYKAPILCIGKKAGASHAILVFVPSGNSEKRENVTSDKGVRTLWFFDVFQCCDC